MGTTCVFGREIRRCQRRKGGCAPSLDGRVRAVLRMTSFLTSGASTKQTTLQSSLARRTVIVALQHGATACQRPAGSHSSPSSSKDRSVLFLTAFPPDSFFLPSRLRPCTATSPSTSVPLTNTSHSLPRSSPPPRALHNIVKSEKNCRAGAGAGADRSGIEFNLGLSRLVELHLFLCWYCCRRRRCCFAPVDLSYFGSLCLPSCPTPMLSTGHTQMARPLKTSLNWQPFSDSMIRLSTQCWRKTTAHGGRMVDEGGARTAFRFLELFVRRAHRVSCHDASTRLRNLGRKRVIVLPHASTSVTLRCCERASAMLTWNTCSSSLLGSSPPCPGCGNFAFSALCRPAMLL